MNVLVLVASASRQRPYASWNSRAAGKMPAPPKYSAGCSSRFEKRPKTVASAKMSHYPFLLCVDFEALFLYLCCMISDAQKTKQACLCCTCCMCASSGAGRLIL